MSEPESFRCLVGGELVTGRQGQVVNPATAEPFASFHIADEHMVDTAVKAAARAFEKWRHAPLSERRALLVRLADIARDNAERLAKLLTLEQGKPLTQAKAEVSGLESCRQP